MKKSRILAAATAFVMGLASLNVSAVAEDMAPQDSVPVLKGTYRTSDYYYNTSLGVAGNFHLFAFDSINVGAHCNGNFAAPNVKVDHANGTNQNTGDNVLYPHEVSLATETIDIQSTTLATDLLIPMGAIVTNASDSQATINGNKISLNTTVTTPSIYHIGPDYIDFGAYKAEYGKLSTQLASAQQTITVPSDGESSLTIELSNGVNVVNLTAAQVQQYQNGIKFTNAVMPSTTQSVIVNVDLKGAGISFKHPGKVTITNTDGTDVKCDELNVNTGVNVLWNFYDSSRADKQYRGTIDVEGAILGSMIAPYATINAGQNVDGTIIANKIKTGGETHRADFKGPLPASIGVDDSKTTTIISTVTSTTPEVTEPEKGAYLAHYVYYDETTGGFKEVANDTLTNYNKTFPLNESGEFVFGTTYKAAGLDIILGDGYNANNTSIYGKYGLDLVWDVYIKKGLTEENSFNSTNDIADVAVRQNVPGYAEQGLKYVTTVNPGDAYKFDDYSNVYFVANLTQNVGVDVTFIDGKKTDDPKSMNVTFNGFGAVKVDTTDGFSNWEGRIEDTWYFTNDRTKVVECNIPLIDMKTGEAIIPSEVGITYDVPEGYEKATENTVEKVNGLDVYHIFLEKTVDQSKFYNVHYVYYDNGKFVEFKNSEGTRVDSNQYGFDESLTAVEPTYTDILGKDPYGKNKDTFVWDVYVMNGADDGNSFNTTNDWTEEDKITGVPSYKTNGLEKIATIKPNEAYTFDDYSNVYLVANVMQKVGVDVKFVDGKKTTGPDSMDVTLGSLGDVTVDTTNNLNTSWSGQVAGNWVNGTSTDAEYVENVPYIGENGQVNDVSKLDVTYTVPDGYDEADNVTFDSSTGVYHIYLKQVKIEYTVHYVFMGTDGKYHELNDSSLFNGENRKTFLNNDTHNVLGKSEICNADFSGGWNGSYAEVDNLLWNVYVSGTAGKLTASDDLTADQVANVGEYSKYGLKNIGTSEKYSSGYNDFGTYESNVYFVVTRYKTTYHFIDNSESSESGYDGDNDNYDTYVPSLQTNESFKVVWRDGETGELYTQDDPYVFDRNRDLYAELVKTGEHTPWAYFNILNYNTKHYIPGDKVFGRVNLDSTASEFLLVNADGSLTSDLSSLEGSEDNYFMVSTLVGVDTDNVSSTRFTISTEGFSGPNFYDVTASHEGGANIVNEFKPFGTNSSAGTVLDVTQALPKDYYNSAECDETKRYDGMRQVRLILPASAFENEVLYINYYYYDNNSNQYLHGRYALKLAQNEFWTLIG